MRARSPADGAGATTHGRCEAAREGQAARTMRLVMLAMLLAFLGPAVGPAQEVATAPEKFRRLLEGLPAQGEQQSFVRTLRLPKTKENQRDARAARASMRHLRERLPAIMAHIKPGTNILDYPGLLALGPVWHGPSDDGPGGTRTLNYSLHVGATLAEVRGLGDSTGFIVRFDESGKILDVDDLICRR